MTSFSNWLCFCLIHYTRLVRVNAMAHQRPSILFGSSGQKPKLVLSSFLRLQYEELDTAPYATAPHYLQDLANMSAFTHWRDDGTVLVRQWAGCALLTFKVSLRVMSGNTLV
ncbi:hypothetical protein HD806DRAFT_467459 [Xylariaceae sp. AK1471]|nr:hypothetical protein HD806DRAFT_467459 [Xylariaceae sp. AK1471]